MKEHWTSIHFLRAFAACAVVIHHVPQYLEGRAGFPLHTFEQGAAGVDVFFIISGFVMHRATSRGRVTWHSFLAKRWIRVLPMYWIVTLSLAAAVWLVPSAFTSFTVPGADLVKSLLFLPVFNPEGSIRPVVSVGWTLYFEMLFYTVVAGWLAVGGRAASLWAGATMVALALCVRVLELSRPHSGFQLLSPIVVEFALGALLSQLLNVIPTFTLPRVVRGLLALGLVFVGFAALGLGQENALDVRRLACWGTCGFLVVAGFLLMEPELAQATALRRLLDPLGSSSYTLYLLHGLLFSILWKATPGALKAAPAAVWLIFLIGTVGISAAVHRALEVPLTRSIGRAFAQWTAVDRSKPLDPRERQTS